MGEFISFIPEAARALDEAVVLTGDSKDDIANRAVQMYTFFLLERSVGHHLALLEKTGTGIAIYELRFSDDPDFHEFSILAARQRARMESRWWRKWWHILKRRSAVRTPE
jgi:hypothetical protein